MWLSLSRNSNLTADPNTVVPLTADKKYIITFKQDAKSEDIQKLYGDIESQGGSSLSLLDAGFVEISSLTDCARPISLRFLRLVHRQEAA